MNKSKFLGSPKITSNANAKDLKPSAILSLQSALHEPFMDGFTAQYCESGSAVHHKGKVIASYDFGDTLVVEKAYRRQGIAQELVYQWRSRYPAPAKASTRTKASQAIQEKVWDRFQSEGFFEKRKASLFKPDEFAHGTTLFAYEEIKEFGIIPMCGGFIQEMYGIKEEADEDEPRGPNGVFFSSPHDEHGLWGAANAMRAAIGRRLGVKWHDVELSDVADYGALLVIEPDKRSSYQYNEDGTSTSLSGVLTTQEPPIGAELQDYYSLETQQVERVIQGDELVELVQAIRRHRDDGVFLFKEKPEIQRPGQSA